MKALARNVLAASALAALAWAAYGADFMLGQSALIATYAIAGLGVVVVVGQTGMIALGQAALVGLGAYVETLLALRGVSVLLSLPAAVLAGALGGWLASLPARRLDGLHFGISTLAFALIVEEALVRAQPWTQGSAGLAVPVLSLGAWRADAVAAQAAISLAALLLALLFCARLLHSRIGRAWRALREDEVAAAACGIEAGGARTLAFACGGALSGLAGALYAHWIGFITPEQFGLMFSFELLMLAFIGGTRRLAGAFWGAVVIIAIPPAIALLRAWLAGEHLAPGGVELMAFGLVIVAVVLLRPQGIAGEHPLRFGRRARRESPPSAIPRPR